MYLDSFGNGWTMSAMLTKPIDISTSYYFLNGHEMSSPWDYICWRCGSHRCGEVGEKVVIGRKNGH